MIRIDDNIDQFERQLSDVAQRQLPFAMAQALNDAAQDVLEAEREEMKRAFDRPTRWTLNAFYVRRATKQNLVATVERKSAVGRRFYLEVQDAGGARRQTGLEHLLQSRLAYAGQIIGVTPAKGARLNSYGNLSPGMIQQVLSDLGAQRDRAQNSTTASRKRNSSRSRYFVPKEGQLSPGVWERANGGKGRLRKVLHFTKSAPRYSKRFNFDEAGLRVARKTFPQHLSRRLKAAIASAR